MARCGSAFRRGALATSADYSATKVADAYLGLT